MEFQSTKHERDARHRATSRVDISLTSHQTHAGVGVWWHAVRRVDEGLSALNTTRLLADDEGAYVVTCRLIVGNMTAITLRKG